VGTSVPWIVVSLDCVADEHAECKHNGSSAAYCTTGVAGFASAKPGGTSGPGGCERAGFSCFFGVASASFSSMRRVSSSCLSGVTNVYWRHFQIAVASDLGRFDGAAAHLLPPSNVSPSQRVRSESEEIATLRLGCLMEGIAHTRVPEGPSRRTFLLENKCVGCGPILRSSSS